MPTQWVKMPPNLVEDKRFLGKSVYQGDYGKWRPQVTTQQVKKHPLHNRHAPHSAGPRKETMIKRQTGDYLDYKNEFDAKWLLAKTLNPELRSPSPQSRTSSVPRYDKAVLQKYLKPTAEAVKEAWKAESTANKRERGQLYGVAGKKIELKSRAEQKQSKQYKPKQLPGFDKWLELSNEYEKAVVYNFVDSVTKDNKTGEARAKTPLQVTQPSTAMEERAVTPDYKPLANAQLTREHFRERRVKSAQGKRSTERILLPQRPKSVNSFYHGEHMDKVEFNIPEEDEAETELAQELVEDQHRDHKEGTCEFCDNRRISQLLDELSRRAPDKFASVAMKHLYRPQMPDGCFYPRRYTHAEYDDYIHPSSFFTSTFAKNRGYFIIAPDWVSERKGIRY